MRKFLLSAVAAVPLAALAQPAQAQRAGDRIPNQHICVFKAGLVHGRAVAGEASRAAQAAGGQITHIYTTAIRGFAVALPDAAVERMKSANPNIAYCEQDQIVSIPPIKAAAAPSNFTAQSQELPWGIARVGGGLAGTYAIAWVIDTGIDPNHPELNVNKALSRSYIGRNSTPWDQNGHGTHVAGTIAAKDNGVGVIGVAPGAPVVSVRVLDRRGSGTTSGVIAGVDYVAQNGRAGQVANMSLGGGVSTTLDTAVVNAAKTGVRFALAAGNESEHANNHSPARANGANVFTVSAFAIGDKFASFSNYGNPPIDYAEPGVSIKSTWLNGGYNTISGTSMATPHLAGLLLLGAVRTNGAVSGDRDTSPDPIGVH